MPPGDNPRTRRRLAERRHRRSGQGGVPTYRPEPLPPARLAAVLSAYVRVDQAVLDARLRSMR